MISRPAATWESSGTRVQNQNQNHKRTRSQLALPAFNIEYGRSPLKHARDAVRRANARFSQSPGPADTNDGPDPRPDVSAKMSDILSHAGVGTRNNPFKRTEHENGFQEELVSDEEHMGMGMKSEGISSAEPPVGALGFSGDISDIHPKHPKRARSASFDEASTPLPSGSDSKASGNGSSSLHQSTSINSNRNSIDQSDVPLASENSTPIKDGMSDHKRAKISSSGTLDAFFARPSALSSQSGPKPLHSKVTAVRRIFSEASSSSQPGSPSTPIQDNRPRLGEGMAEIPATPTIKQLRAIPSLDLRTVTPSPRKRALHLGNGMPSAGSPLKARAASAGAALALGRSESVGERQKSLDIKEKKEESKRAASELHEDKETLKSTTVESGTTKPFTFSLYPPSINDVAAAARAQRALSNLSSALDKLAMPPPSKPNTSSASRTASGNEQLRRPASEQRQRIRPSTSLGFTREMSVPVPSTGSKGNGRPSVSSRAGSVGPGQAKKSFLPPPPPPAFGSSLVKERGKTKAFTNASRTTPLASGSGGCKTDASGNGQRHPSSFRFGLGPIGGMAGVFGRPIPRIRASQKTSLETVQGSPVKGGVPPRAFKEDDEDEIVTEDGVEEQRDKHSGGNVPATSYRPLNPQVTSVNANGDTSVSSAEGSDALAVADAANATTRKEVKRISKLNASRRASMAFSALSQSLGASPDTAIRDSNINTGTTNERPPTEQSNAKKERTASTAFSSSTSSRPVRAAAPRSFGYSGLGRTRSEAVISANARSSSVTPAGVSESDSEGTAKNSSKKSGSMGRTKMPGSLDVLDQCTIFVDVRTEDGDDAGALFVDMLRGLGAKVLTRVGQTCTHIVYKNGLSSTLTRYRLLDEPRPSVVGIGWVVECVEKRARVEEARFQVNLEGINVAGTLKRRRSFLPKQLLSSYTPGPMDTFLNGSGADTTTATCPVPKACANSDPASEDGDTSQERVTSNSGGLSSNIHPLERARRRSIMISR